jgi:hypothetical protein
LLALYISKITSSSYGPHSAIDGNASLHHT